MSPRVDPKKSSKRNRSYFSGFDWKNIFTTGWGLFKVVLVGLLCLLVFLGFYDFYQFARTTSRLTVNIKLRGNKKISKKQLRAALVPGAAKSSRPDWGLRTPAGDTVSILAVAPGAIKTRLKEKFPRFENVEVKKQLPHELIIRVKERTPLGLVRRSSSEWKERKFLPVDREGVIFTIQPGEKKEFKKQLPFVMGLEKLSPETAKFKRRWSKFLQVRELSRKIFNRRIFTWYRFKPGGLLVAELNRPRTLVIHLGKKNYEPKLRRLYEMMTTDAFHQIDNYIDLTDPEDVRAR